MSKHLIGLTLIDAPYSALNNAGMEASQATENVVAVKNFKKDAILIPMFPGKHGETGGVQPLNTNSMNGKIHP